MNVRAIEDSRLHISTDDLPPGIGQRIRALAVFPNPKRAEAERHFRPYHHLPEYVDRSEREPGFLSVPRGLRESVAALLADNGYRLQVEDRRERGQRCRYPVGPILTDAQMAPVEELLQHENGIFWAPAGTGKSHIALALIVRLGVNAVIWVHTKELQQQWLELIRTVLQLDDTQLGAVGGGSNRVGTHITVAMVQTAAKRLHPELLRVGLQIVDEAHHCPADMTSGVVEQVPALYRFGLTATPERRDNMHPLNAMILGPIRARIHAAAIPDRLIRPRIDRRDTDITSWGNNWAEIISDLVANPRRNRMILRWAEEAVDDGRRLLILTERVDHCDALAAWLTADGYRATSLHSGTGRAERAGIKDAIASGSTQVVVATSQLIGEGWDCPSLDCMILATPISFHGKLEQCVGRVCRTAPGKQDALVIDLTDDHPMMWASWKKRREAYERLGYIRYGLVA